MSNQRETHISRTTSVLVQAYAWVTGIATVAWMLSLRLADLSPAERVARVAGWAPTLLGFAASLALMAMALIESVKRPLRSAFHATQLRQWLNWRQNSQGTEIKDEDPSQELMRMVAPRYPDDVLGLPSELLCAQIGSSVELAMAQPRRYEALLRALAGEWGNSDVDEYLRHLPDSRTTDVPSNERQKIDAALIDARNAVSERIQRHLDSFQVHLSARWSFRLHLMAVVLAALLGTVGAALFGALRTDPGLAVIVVVIASLVGGVLAPLLRDVIALTERRRR